MASGFQKAIRISEAIANIGDRSYLLPSIQRKFVWSADKVETLFDSIMRGYPINSFMFWSITDSNIKKNFRFYEFLNEYREFYKVNNPDFDTIDHKDFYAVIDGQQRLTGLYIGLKGTYAYKMPRKWWVDNEDALPTRHLFLNLKFDGYNSDERNMKYEFRFLSKSDFNRLSDNTDQYWFKVRDILGLKDMVQVNQYLTEHNLMLNQTAAATLMTLWQRIHVDELIVYYLEEKQDIDAVLDIFIRTNSGGVPLSFSNLLMSITIANWNTGGDKDGRKAIADLVQEVNNLGRPGFMISEDFILKTCLVLFKDNIKFSVKNFDASTVALFGDNWIRIRKCIVETFRMLETWGFNNSSLRAKNAVIPLIYYVYHAGLEDQLSKKTYLIEDKNRMRKWLCIALLKGIFGGQTDSILTKIRAVIKRDMVGGFPSDSLVKEFQGQERNFGFDDDFIDRLLTTQMEDSNAYVILSLLYSHLNFEMDKYHKDHLHPASAFASKNLKAVLGGENYPIEFRESSYWNSIVNLQLLNSGLNESKNDKPLKDWLDNVNVNLESQLIPIGVSYDFIDFPEFYKKRKELLAKKLKDIAK